MPDSASYPGSSCGSGGLYAAEALSHGSATYAPIILSGLEPPGLAMGSPFNLAS